MQTTIVIVTFRGGIIHKCIKNLQNNYQIIIVENSNNINLKRKIEKSYRNIKCYLTGSNIGYARANNIGLRKVKTKFALVINPDVTISSKQVKQIENIAKKIIKFSVLTPNSNGLLETITNNSDKLSNIEKKDLKSLRNDISTRDFFEINFVPGYCMFFNMKDIKKINFFDENFFLYFEDIDICKRLKNLRKKLFLLSKIKVHHLYGGFYEKKAHYGKHHILKKKSLKKWHLQWADRNWHLYWSSFYYHRKHYGFIKSFKVHFSKLLRFFFLKNFYFLINNKNLYYLFKARSEGLMYQILNKSAFSGPKIK